MYRSGLSGRDRVGVIYGDFETREEAAAAMLSLPETIKAASDRFGAGSPEVNAVAAAWGAVLVS